MVGIIISTLLAHPPVPSYVDRPSSVVRDVAVSLQPRLDDELESYQLDTIVSSVSIAGERWDVDPLFLVSLGWVESRLTPTALGDGGKSHGMYQINVNTAWGRKGSASPCRRSGVCGKKALRCMSGRDQCALAIEISTDTAAYLLSKYRFKWPGHGAVIYNCGRRCCVKRSSRGKCLRHARWTGTARKYFSTYRRIIRDIADAPGI